MSQDLTVRLVHHRGVPVVVVRGDLDVHVARQMLLRGRELVDAALGAAPARPSTPGGAHEGRSGGRPDTAVDRRAVVLDLSGVPFADSAGIGSIVGVLRRALQREADLLLAGVDPHLADVLHVMGLDQVLALHATVQEATDAVSPDGRHGPGAGPGARDDAQR